VWSSRLASNLPHIALSKTEKKKQKKKKTNKQNRLSSKEKDPTGYGSQYINAMISKKYGPEAENMKGWGEPKSPGRISCSEKFAVFYETQER
jgi:hypothetical protein